ncbi:MAG TPA: hypothetical protein VFY06_15465 [Verrucomicrobiae bacterium]|nr:hypothetical protein [Verrucomicrobiae bacterium]
MNPNWAEENLQTIRTLMERSALYRRALAPIMLFAGVLGVAAAAVGLWLRLDSMQAFGALWLATAAFVVAGAFLIARRQALKATEAFWSPPTRRVAQALSAPLGIGLFVGIWFGASRESPSLLAVFWILFYGCALHAAGFFTPRGVRWLGWAFIAGAFLLVILHQTVKDLQFNPHLLMGLFFGMLHLACGVYLYLTEKGKNAA